MVPGAAPPARPPGRWSGRWRVRIVVALLAAITVLPAVPGGLPATPAAADTCDGVWVVVDARSLGGSITTRCAPGTPGSGLAALETAGHRYSFVPRNPGMVCTLDARPDPCNGAPVDAYWSYWHAPAGGSWTYASFGAGNRTPPPGSVEGWRFGDGSAPPGVPPPANEPAPATDDGGGDSSTSGSDEDGDARAGAETGSRGTADPPSGDGGGRDAEDVAGSSRGGDTTSSQRRDTTADDAADTDAGGEDAPGADRTDDDGQDTATRPGWDPPPVETGAWANPPEDRPVDPPESDTSAPRTQDGEPADGDTDRADQETATEPLAAPGGGDSDRTTPVGALTGLGLLAGIGALTYRQRRLRTEVGP